VRKREHLHGQLGCIGHDALNLSGDFGCCSNPLYGRAGSGYDPPCESEKEMTREAPLRAEPEVPPIRWMLKRAVTESKSTLDKRLWFHAAKAMARVRTIGPAWKLAHQYGPGVEATTGLSTTRQFLQIWTAASRHWLPPKNYYMYRLYEPEKWRRIDEYLDSEESFVMTMHLYKRRSSRVARLEDKVIFFEACRDAGLASVSIVAEFSHGALAKWYVPGPVKLPRADLFSKYARGIKGKGAGWWLFNGGERWVGPDGRALTEEELMRHLCDLTHRGMIILQPRILNHAALSALSPGALCTARVVTVLQPDGTPQHLLSAFRMPIDDSPVDNFSQGHLASAINERTGELGPAFRYAPEYGDSTFRIHPHTGRHIEGFLLPFWKETLELCLRAQQVFSEFFAVGWDVAITQEGPLVVEGNHDFGVNILQITHDIPIGLTKLPRVYWAHEAQLRAR
jgi:hypothetical protein